MAAIGQGQWSGNLNRAVAKLPFNMNRDDAMFHILLAEDDEVMREYLTRALTRSGYRVTAVDRGTAALPLLESQRFDLLLTDIVMPEMDGIELASARLRWSPTCGDVHHGFAAVTLKAGQAVPNAASCPNPSTCETW